MTGELLQVAERPHECCREPRNMIHVTVLGSPVSYDKCAVCGRRHFIAEFEAGVYPMTGEEVG